MAIYKIFPEKDTFISSYHNTQNYGRDEILEISNENEAAQEGKGDNFARIKMNVVMQLKEGTDFVMSFSIE